jgi:hypothetical protein
VSETTPGSASQPLSSGGIESTTRDNEPLYGDEITIGYFDPLPTSDVAVLVDALSSRFHKVRAERRPSPPWASPLLEWAAITITISSGMVMKGFLEEMGKDIWHGLRAGLYRLYTTAKSRAYYPSFHAFALETNSGWQASHLSDRERYVDASSV